MVDSLPVDTTTNKAHGVVYILRTIEPKRAYLVSRLKIKDRRSVTGQFWFHQSYRR